MDGPTAARSSDRSGTLIPCPGAWLISVFFPSLDKLYPEVGNIRCDVERGREEHRV